MKILNVFLYLFFLSHTGQASTESFDKLWSQGKIENSFAQAKKEKKSILLYWGAVWCPPCNDLKSQIFSHPDFAQLSAPFMRVYLDGDSEDAQSWGDKLGVTGYPTILILNSQQKELYRISNSLSWEEFREILEAALKNTGTFEEALKLAENSSTDPNIWKLLAHSTWYQAKESTEEKVQYIQRKHTLIGKVPKAQASEKAALISSLFSEALSSEISENTEIQKLKKELEKETRSYFENLWKDSESIWASRNLFTYDAVQTLTWTQSFLSSSEFAYLFKKWEEALVRLRSNVHATLESTLWTYYAEIKMHENFAKLYTKPFQQLQKDLRLQVEKSKKLAQSDYERYSVLSSSAYLLKISKQTDIARSLLLSELKSTKTPWYLESSLSRLEEEEGNIEKALQWSAKARLSAKGNSTRLQWIRNDLLLNLKHAPKNLKTIQSLVQEYYDLAFSMKDGFHGRNGRTALKLKKELEKHKENKEFVKLLKSYQNKCLKEASLGESVCRSIL